MHCGALQVVTPEKRASLNFSTGSKGQGPTGSRAALSSETLETQKEVHRKLVHNLPGAVKWQRECQLVIYQDLDNPEWGWFTLFGG